MINGKVLTIVLPAYNAETTLTKTYNEIPHEIVDHVILVDDNSWDKTTEVASGLGIQNIIKHEQNRGYGANQKTCYTKALALKSDIVVMLHPDYQYTPKLIHSMAALIANNTFDCVLGSRILGVGALKGGMPLYKYLSNRFLTAFENVLLGYKLSEYHTGYRAYSRRILENIPYNQNSDNFVFDNQMLAQIIYKGYSIGEITCPTRYDRDSSSINIFSSIQYGFGVIKTSIEYRLHKMHLIKSNLFKHSDY